MPRDEMLHVIPQQLFSNSTQWRDGGRKKLVSRCAYSKQTTPELTLWLGHGDNPAGLELQLITWSAGVTGPSKSGFTSVLAPQDEDPLEVETCRKLCNDGRITDAAKALEVLVQRRCRIPNNLFYRVLKRCIAHKDLMLGRRIHALSLESGYEGDAFLANHLMGLYASHGRLEEAMGVFSTVSNPNTYNWATIIFAHARHGESAQAIRLYRRMRDSMVKPDNRIFSAVIKACAAAGDLGTGREVHSDILANPGMPDIFVQNGLLDMYAKCRSLEDARSVFDSLPDRNVVTWNTMLAGYAQQGMSQETFRLYGKMLQEGVSFPDSITFLCLLQVCASVGSEALHQAKQVHAQIREQGLQDDVVLGGSLVNTYAKCGSLEDARRVFDRLSHKRNVVTWNAMIAGYAQQGLGHEAFSLCHRMQQEGFSPSSVTFVSLLQACASIGVGALAEGKQVHAQIVNRGLEHDEVVGGSLVNMYAKCGSVEDARSVFDRLGRRTVVTWTAMIAGYVQRGMGQDALDHYNGMKQEGFSPPDSVTFLCLLQACAIVGGGALHEGKQIHAQIEEFGLEDDVGLGGSLVNMYAKCGSFETARTLFDRLPSRNLVTWNAILSGCAQQGMGEEALSLYKRMRQEGVCSPDSVTFVCLLQACAMVGTGAVHEGEELHAQIEERGLQEDVVVSGALVNMYAKCGNLALARSIFDSTPNRNAVTWTAMIAGYAQHGMGEEALGLYSDMQQQEGPVAPLDHVTVVCLFQACAIVGGLPLGKQLHAEIAERGMQTDVVVGSALVNMYAKCGSIAEAQLVFDSLPERSREAWNALIGGYTRQGNSEVVFRLLDRMRAEGGQPNGITFLSVLTVCSHVGLVDQGRKYFESMRTECGITPTVEHCSCMIDLLSRAGHLDEALQMAKAMPFPATDAVWLSLLSACQKWSDGD